MRSDGDQMNTLQQANRSIRLTSHRRKRKKRGIQLFIAYALQATIVSLGLIILLLLICGCLYIEEHVFSAPYENQSDESDYFETSEGTVDDSVPVKPMAKTQLSVVLDAGHGGNQPGCVIKNVVEKDITLSIVLLLQEKLESNDVVTFLTRDTDEDVSLSDRSEIANSAGADYFISIHCNSYTDDSSVKGFECYCYQSTESKYLAESITLSADSHSILTRKVKEADYAVLRDTTIPAILIEVGFLTNVQECGKLLSPEYQEILADAIVNGILSYDNTF